MHSAEEGGWLPHALLISSASVLLTAPSTEVLTLSGQDLPESLMRPLVVYTPLSPTIEILLFLLTFDQVAF